MTTRLHHYLGRLQQTILSREEIEVAEMEILDRSDRPGQTSEFYARLRFHDDSQLKVVEKLLAERFTIIKARYGYHSEKPLVCLCLSELVVGVGRFAKSPYIFCAETHVRPEDQPSHVEHLT